MLLASSHSTMIHCSIAALVGGVGIEIMLELHEPAIVIDQPFTIFWIYGESNSRRSRVDANQHFLPQITGHEILVSSVWAVGILTIPVNGHGLIGSAREIKDPLGLRNLEIRKISLARRLGGIAVGEVVGKSVQKHGPTVEFPNAGWVREKKCERDCGFGTKNKMR